MRVKSKSTVKELMAPEVRMVTEKPERETTTAIEEDEEEVVLLVLKAVKIVPKLLVTKKKVKANVVVVVAVAIEDVVVAIKVKTKPRRQLQAERKDPRELGEIAEVAEVVVVTNNLEPKVKEKTLMARIESRTKTSLSSK